MNKRQLQTLRCIDKFDKLGRDGVVSLLQKPEEEFGAGLTLWEAELIGQFLDCQGDTNQETLKNLTSWFSHAHKVRGRVELMVLLDQGDGYTVLDKLIDYPTNNDDTWSLTSRPENIAFAIDDIICAAQRRAFAPSSKCTFEALANAFALKEFQNEGVS